MSERRRRKEEGSTRGVCVCVCVTSIVLALEFKAIQRLISFDL